ncbi:peroxidase family protein [Nocardiopsis baichengensis]|uniref:peroxidase family protein n=1 Tax=Nocardiopsis baichengensis TaxID=280240 RepID=UPI00034C9ABF|nr:heme peroxidase family protein [Nocardiopsis baichengensis]
MESRSTTVPTVPEQLPVEVTGAGDVLPQPESPTRTHGYVPRGLGYVPESRTHEGRFGRMFRRLPPFVPGPDEIAEIAAVMADPQPPDRARDNPDIPAGYTYLGQFVDHDLTLDTSGIQERRDDPDALTNFRTPRFDLDGLYGRGPADQPYLYEAGGSGRLAVDRRGDLLDLPRSAQGTALLGDPRNDENILVGQVHLTMALFHNRVLELLEDLPGLERRPGEDDFALAQRTVRWHYQWMVVHDFLRRIVGERTLADVLVREPLIRGGRPVEQPRLRFFGWKRNPFMPVEFSVAAYRFGHSLVRAGYKFNTTVPPLPTFVPTPVSETDPLAHLGGFRPLPDQWQVEWDRFFPISGKDAERITPSRAIDPLLAPPLLELPPEVAPVMASLAERNLTRGARLGLPSGQGVARAMGADPLTDEELDLPRPGPAPLWFYVLREAEVQCRGRHLGPVGGRIVAEVVLGLMAADPASYLAVEPGWRPTLPSQVPGDFTMPDLVSFTGFGLRQV